MQDNKTLIDKAVKICGSDAALCRRIGISPALLSLMKKGERGITPATAIYLADLVNEDATEAMMAAVIDSEKNTARRAMLVEILGKGLAAGGAALLVSSYKTGSRTATNKEADSFTKSKHPIHRIYWKFWGLIMGWSGDCTCVHRALAYG